MWSIASWRETPPIADRQLTVLLGTSARDPQFNGNAPYPYPIVADHSPFQTPVIGWASVWPWDPIPSGRRRVTAWARQDCVCLSSAFAVMELICNRAHVQCRAVQNPMQQNMTEPRGREKGRHLDLWASLAGTPPIDPGARARAPSKQATGR